MTSADDRPADDEGDERSNDTVESGVRSNDDVISRSDVTSGDDVRSGDEVEVEIESDREDSDSDRVGHARSSGRPLEDELGRIDLMSTPEGYVEGRVTDLESIDETTVRLAVTLPHDATVDFELEKPIPWSDEFLFARIVEDVGYDAASVGHLVGEPVYVTRADLEDDDDGPTWWTWTLRDAGRYLESSLSERFGIDGDRGPEWRLVDPLERPDPEPDDGRWSTLRDPTLAAAVVLLGTLTAVLGAVTGATGGLALTSAAFVYALPGLALVAIGLAALMSAD